MKSLTAISLAVLMALAMIVSVIPASAVTVDSVEVRGPVYNGTNLEAIFADVGLNESGEEDQYYLEMNATNFAGFYYDIDGNVSTEKLYIYNATTDGVTDLVDDTTIEENGLEYVTTIDHVDYKSTNLGGNYPVLGLFAEKYVPIDDSDAGKLAKLLIDNNDKHTLRTGELLDLSNGFAVTAKQIDVDGNKVWMELTKDGEFVEDNVIVPGTDGSNWTYERDDVAGEDEVEVFIIHVTDAFQGQVDSLVVVEGMWLIDYTDIREVESGDDFGELEASLSGDTLTFANSDPITLTADSTQNIAEGLKFEVADDSDGYLRFFLMKEYTEPGTYQVRGTVYEDDAGSWDYSNFAGFFYELDNNVETESLEITTATLNDNQRVIDEDELTYVTTIDHVDYKSTNFGGNYPVIGLFAEKYVPIDDSDAGKLAKLLVDNNDKHTMRTGELLDLSNGFAVTAKQIDVDGNKVWMELTKDGEFVEDNVIVPGDDGSNWTYERDDVAGEDEVEVFIIHVTDAFQGQVDSLVVVEGMWLIDYTDIREIESGDDFGELEASLSGATLTFNNSATITLTADSTQNIAEGMKFAVADADDLRYFLFKEYTIGDEAAPAATPVATEAPVETEAAVEETEVPAEVATEAPVVVAPTEVETEAPVVTEPPEEEPGFEAIFAIAGLLAVAYLVRRD